GPIVSVDNSKFTALRAGKTNSVPITVRRPDGTPARNESVYANVYTHPMPASTATGCNNQKGAYQPYAQQQLRLDEQGQGMLQFQGPPKFETNNAILEVELSEGVSKKTARRAVQTLPAVPSQLDVDFFPEGGDLIAGVTNHVYYRVRSPQGE